MKKLSFVVIAITSLVLAPVAFADETPVSGYYSLPSPSLAAKAAAVSYATEIFVSNTGPTPIHTIVPTQLNLNTNSLTITPVHHDSYTGKTRIVLRDVNNVPFYDNLVCRYAFIDVKGIPGDYTVNINQFC